MRWLRTALVTGVVTGAAVAIYVAFRAPAPESVIALLSDFVGASIGNAIIWGTAVNFVVALFPANDAKKTAADTSIEGDLEQDSTSRVICQGCGKRIDERMRAMHQKYCPGLVAPPGP